MALYSRLANSIEESNSSRFEIDWLRLSALAAMHFGCLAVFLVGWSWTAVGLALVLYVVRAFGLTAFYHRYFSHRAFKTSRWFQFVGGLLGTLAMQKGPLWWAAHHREHHRSSDRMGDVHSPHVDSFFWAHLGWIMGKENGKLKTHLVRDWLKFPELRMLEHCASLVAVGYAVALYALGDFLGRSIPSLETNGWQVFIWGFFVSTVLLYHATYSVNSIAHMFGTQRFRTEDHSRNNLIVAIFSLGEGWHNNHHRYPTSARQGFVWWELDMTYYGLWTLERLGLVWKLRPVPAHVISGDGTPVSAKEHASH